LVSNSLSFTKAQKMAIVGIFYTENIPRAYHYDCIEILNKIYKSLRQRNDKLIVQDCIFAVKKKYSIRDKTYGAKKNVKK